MKKILCSGLLALTFLANAQITPSQRCGSGTLPQQFEDWVQILPPSNTGGGKGGGQSTQSVFNIPVVVHVIHNGGAVNNATATTGQNLNAAQIQDQINILNRDFNGLNPDTANIPAVFKPFLGKFQFNFCLAVVNPTGGVMPEPGIDRIDRNTKGWTAPPFTTNYITTTIKPNSIWDPNRYMNMWVCSISGGILGYATFPAPGTSGLAGLNPPYGTATTDGLVMLNTAFGSIGTAVSGAPYNLGRTAVHEIGHWLGLRHIWGDGTCATDFCNDTPPAQQSNFGCPVFPYKVGVCAGNTTGEMTMNIMDYTDDACMYMFSNDQKNRAQLIMTNSPMRLTLLSSTVCNLPSVVNDIGITFVSSPTYSQVINCDNYINPVIRVNNYGSNAITTATFNYNVDGANTQSYAWTGSIAPSGSVNIAMPQVNNLTNGAHVYSVNVTAPNGLTDPNLNNNNNTQNFTIANSFTLAAASNPTSICIGNTATLTGSGGATTYSWNPGAIVGSTAAVTPAATTIYTLTGKTGTCVNTRTLSLTVTPSLSITVNSATVCAGTAAVLNASGATTYTWNTGSNAASVSVTPLSTTVYTVSGNQGTCAGNKTTTVTVNASPTVAVNSATVCAGTTATLTATGATAYSWNTGAITGVINVTPAATTVYTVTGTANGCSNVKTSTVVVNASPTVAVNSSTVCAGNSATLTASGAGSYTWNTGASTAVINVTPAATTVYTVTGTSTGCTNVKTATVTVNTNPTVTVNSATVCSGTSAALTASGATSYLWNTGATTASLNVTPASTTVYTVTGSNGSCTNVKTTTVIVNASPTVAVNSSTICSGSTATLTAGGATNYSWNTGAATAAINVSPASTTVYTVTGTSNGCTNSKTATVTVNTTPTVSVNSSTVCAGTPATLTATGAASYLWNTGAASAVITVTPASSTVYTVTGSNGTCTNVKTSTVTVNAIPTITSANNSPVCSASNINLTANSIAGTSYVWSGPNGFSSTTQNPIIANATAANAGVYTVTATGINGCTNKSNSTVIVNATPTINVNSFTICPGGSATLTANGATSYLWNTGSTSNPLVISPAGNTVYTVTGTSSGCSSANTSTVTVGTALSINMSPSAQTICSGNSTTISASGATTYTWSTGFVGSSIVITPTSNATYNVVGVSGSCTGSNVASVNVSAAASIVLNSANVLCNGMANGSATVTPSGGVAPYTYNFSNGVTTQVASGLSAGNYTATVTTSLGCVSSSAFTISEPSALALNTSAVNSSCGNCNGAITATATGGTAVYSYSFMPGGSSANLCAGNYTVITSDANGCMVSAPVNVSTSGSSINSSAVASNASCGMCADGSAVVAVAGGVSPYTYTWSPSGGNNQMASGLMPGCYTVTIADQTMCSTTATACVGFATGLLSTTLNGFNIYPNPTNGNVTIEFENESIRTIEVIDVTGRLIVSERSSAQIVQVDLENFSSGVYYVTIKDADTVKQTKIIKQ